MNPRELIEDAMNQVDTYKSPNIDEAQELINKILVAAELGSTGNDEITSIKERQGEIHIATSYSVRCCAMTNSYSFPATILDALDPLKAAAKYGLEQKVKKLQAQVAEKHREIAYNQKFIEESSVKLTELQRQLTTLNSTKGALP